MSTEDLNLRYGQLRRELEAAYATWDVERIDSTSARMLPLERALSSTRSTWTLDGCPPLGGEGHGAAGVGGGPA